MCSKCRLHPGFIVKGHGKLRSEVGGLLERVSTPAACGQRLQYCNRADSSPNFQWRGKKTLKSNSLHFSLHQLSLPLTWGFPQDGDYATIIQFIFLTSLSQKIRQWATNCSFYSKVMCLWCVINWTEFLFVSEGDIEILRLLLLDNRDVALEYSEIKLWLWNWPLISVPQKLISGLSGHLASPAFCLLLSFKNVFGKDFGRLFI